MNTLKQTPSWLVLFVLFVVLLTGYYIRPDNVTEDALKAVIGALLLSIQPRTQQPPSP